MFKYLRMDAYRLIKTKTLYVARGGGVFGVYDEHGGHA